VGLLYLYVTAYVRISFTFFQFFFIFTSFSSKPAVLYQSLNRYLLQFYVPVSAPCFPKFPAFYSTDKFWLLFSLFSPHFHLNLRYYISHLTDIYCNFMYLFLHLVFPNSLHFTPLINFDFYFPHFLRCLILPLRYQNMRLYVYTHPYSFRWFIT